jgi:hypothetical protein
MHFLETEVHVRQLAPSPCFRSAVDFHLTVQMGQNFASGSSGSACRGVGKLMAVSRGIDRFGRSIPGCLLPTPRVGDAEQPGGLSDSSRRSKPAKTSGIYAQD